MKSPSDTRPGELAQPLRQHISAELTRVLRGHVLALTALLAASMLLLAYHFKRDQLVHQAHLAHTRLSTELRSFSRELQSLSNSRLVATFLTDGRDRDWEVALLNARFRQDGLHGLLLLDHRGRELPALNHLSTTGVADLPAVQQALRSGRSAHGMGRADDGAWLLFLVEPVFLPELDRPVGFVLGTIDVQALMATMAPGRALMALALDDAPLQPPPPQDLMLRARADAVIGSGPAEVRLTVVLSESLLPWLVPALMGVLAVFLLGHWTLSRVTVWADRFSGATTQRLEHLVASCEALLAGRSLAPLPAGPQDEISQVQQTLGEMLRRQKQVTDELRTGALVFATAAEGIVVSDAQDRVTQVNPALLRMTGLGEDALIGRPIRSLYRLAEGDVAQVQLWRVLGLRGRWSGECALLDRQGRALETTVSVSELVDVAGLRVGQVWVFTDVSRLKRAEHRLREMAYRDGLTRLPNLRVMGERVRQRLASSPAPCALLFLDIDRLKQVNDGQGHEAGDWMIRGMAEHLRRHLPDGHLLCRRSGDEFIALVERDPDSDAPGWQALLARLSQAQVMLPGGPLNVTATIGVARYPRDAQAWPELQVCADVAMRAAKQVRRGSVAWYDPVLGGDLRRQARVQQRLAQALAQQRIKLHYQPVVDLASGRRLGAEALACWHDPELGEVSPAEFFAAALDAQLADALHLQLLQQLLRDMPRIQQRSPGLVLAFNVAPRSLCDPRQLEALADAVTRHPHWLGLLELELTESAMAGSEEALLEPLQRLGRLGLRLVIDDFGTGHSSLSRLAQLPWSGLKLDGSFVAQLDQGRQQRIVALVLSLARTLHLQVTAEGVETQAQRQHLLRLGCARGQGWLYGQAMGLDDLLRPPAQAHGPRDPAASSA